MGLPDLSSCLGFSISRSTTDELSMLGFWKVHPLQQLHPGEGQAILFKDPGYTLDPEREYVHYLPRSLHTSFR